MTTPRASRNDQYGRRFYPIPSPVTHELLDLPSWTNLKRLLASPALESWKMKNIAREIALDPSLQMLAGDDETLYQAVKQALDKSQDKANVGTAVHRYTELADRGMLDLDLVPVAARKHLEHYARAQREHEWELVEAEVTVWNAGLDNDCFGWAGTCDRFLKLPGFGVVVADLKTGKDVYPDTAWQLAAYANAEGIWSAPDEDSVAMRPWRDAKAELEHNIAKGENVPKGRRKWSEAAIKDANAELAELYWQSFAAHDGHRPMPAGLRRDVGVVIHATADDCRVVVLDLETDPPAVSVVRSLAKIWGWQRQDKAVVTGPLVTGKNVVPPRARPVGDNAASDAANTETSEASDAANPDLTLAELGEYMKARVVHIASNESAVAMLRERWNGTKVANLDETGLGVLSVLLDDIEATYSIPFGPDWRDFSSAYKAGIVQAMIPGSTVK